MLRNIRYYPFPLSKNSFVMKRLFTKTNISDLQEDEHIDEEEFNFTDEEDNDIFLNILLVKIRIFIVLETNTIKKASMNRRK